MTAHILTFTGSRKPRRETKADIGERIMPKVFGILADLGPGCHGGFEYCLESLPEIAKIGGPLFFVRVLNGGETILDVWLYQKVPVGGRNELFEGRGWIRRMDFRNRAQWVPAIIAVESREIEFRSFVKAYRKNPSFL